MDPKALPMFSWGQSCLAALGVLAISACATDCLVTQDPPKSVWSPIDLPFQGRLTFPVADETRGLGSKGDATWSDWQKVSGVGVRLEAFILAELFLTHTLNESIHTPPLPCIDGLTRPNLMVYQTSSTEGAAYLHNFCSGTYEF